MNSKRKFDTLKQHVGHSVCDLQLTYTSFHFILMSHYDPPHLSKADISVSVDVALLTNFPQTHVNANHQSSFDLVRLLCHPLVQLEECLWHSDDSEAILARV